MAVKKTWREAFDEGAAGVGEPMNMRLKRGRLPPGWKIPVDEVLDFEEYEAETTVENLGTVEHTPHRAGSLPIAPLPPASE